MDKLLEELFGIFAKHLLASPAFKEQLMLAVTEQLEGLNIGVDEITGFDSSVQEIVEHTLRDVSIRIDV